MKHTYFSTFISGLGEVVTKALESSLKSVSVTLLLDGLVVYETESDISTVKALPFFNNSYYLVSSEKGPVRFEIVTRDFSKIPLNISKGNSFRVIYSKENELSHIPKNELLKLEDYFSKALNVTLDRAKPDLEIWFLERSEGYAFCGIRLTKKPSTEKFLQKGELRPELSWILCFLSEPKSVDIFLDPFAGYGALPKARLTFPYTKIIASDIDSTKIEKLQEMFQDPTCEVHRWDATKLPLPDSSVTTIVTDPPWGHYEEEDIETLYKDMFTECERVLVPNGILIVLSAQKELVTNIIEGKKNLHLLDEYNILVSGKKSGVYKLTKNG